MKTNKLILFMFFLASITLLSFSPYSYKNNEKDSGKVKSMALVSVVIGSVNNMKTFASHIDNKISSIAPLIVELENKSVYNMRDSLAASLKKYFNCEILYGSSLVNRPEYIELTKKYNFPENVHARGGVIPTNIIPGDEKFIFPDYYQFFLWSKKKTKSYSTDICKLLGTDLIAISITSIFVPQVQIGSLSGHFSIGLGSTIFIYDKEGNVYYYGCESKYVRTEGDVLNDYKTLLDKYPQMLPKIVSKLSEEVLD